MKLKHIRFSERNQEQLAQIKEQYGCIDDSEAVRTALALAVGKVLK
jgi:hypothetical protein